MDPNALSNLDPKLKETYEKVMGTNTNSTPDAQQSSPESIPTQQPVSNNNPDSTTNSNLSAPIQSPPANDPTQSNETPQTVTINQPTSTPATSASEIITKPKSNHAGLLKFLYILGGTVFFIIYIFFWMKIFNISLPF